MSLQVISEEITEQVNDETTIAKSPWRRLEVRLSIRGVKKEAKASSKPTRIRVRVSIVENGGIMEVDGICESKTEQK